MAMEKIPHVRAACEILDENGAKRVKRRELD